MFLVFPFLWINCGDCENKSIAIVDCRTMKPTCRKFNHQSAYLAAHNLTQYQYPPKTKFQLPVPYPWPLKIYTQSYSLPIIKEVDVIVNRMINDLNGDNGDNIAYIRYD